MGCDIHLFVEVRGADGKWQPADNWEPNEHASQDGERSHCVPYEKRFYNGRNYNLFAILADVRNGRGFAGIKTGEGFVPIDHPRGLPDDVTDLIRAESDGWGVDGHSHSHLTVSELLAYDWTQETQLQGVLDATEYRRWNRWDRKNGEGPERYSGSVSGGMVRNVAEAEMIQLLEPLKEERDDVVAKKLDHVYTSCTWQMPYYKCCRDFLSDTLPRLLRLGKPEDVRIVFWFDN